uniref:Uncharacterized protein n=1 Tax=Lynx canadensis TaxID=61383 RepID=A0A667IF71_LYNCA
VSAPDSLLENLGSEARSQYVSPGERHKPPKRKIGIKRHNSRGLGVEGVQKWTFAGFPCFFGS